MTSKKNQTVISRKEFANNLLYAFKDLPELVQADFDSLRFRMVAPRGEVVNLETFYQRYLEGDNTSFIEEICRGLGQPIGQPEGAGNFAYKLVKTPHGPKIIWPSSSEK